MESKSFKVGDIVKMKKPHPCGSYEWEILRTGMDFGIKCCGCGHFVMLARPKFEKAVKAVVTPRYEKNKLKAAGITCRLSSLFKDNLQAAAGK